MGRNYYVTTARGARVWSHQLSVLAVAVWIEVEVECIEFRVLTFEFWALAVLSFEFWVLSFSSFEFWVLSRWMTHVFGLVRWCVGDVWSKLGATIIENQRQKLILVSRCSSHWPWLLLNSHSASMPLRRFSVAKACCGCGGGSKNQDWEVEVVSKNRSTNEVLRGGLLGIDVLPILARKGRFWKKQLFRFQKIVYNYRKSTGALFRGVRVAELRMTDD